MFRVTIPVVIALCASSGIAQAESAREVFIDNGRIRVGVDVSIGGAVTYASKVGCENMINSCDWGRQIQQSYYSGPPNYTREGKEKSPSWAGFPWNPIQSGDCYGNGSKVLDYRSDKDSLYVKTRPMLWPMRDDAGECSFETWITLKGTTFTWRARLTNERKDTTPYGAYSQELPAVYTNGPWHKLMSYTGDKPFSGGELVEVRNDHHEPWPWTRFLTTERWSALVNDQGEGIGVWHPTAIEHDGGFAGRRGRGGPKDSPTGYMAPVRQEILDHNIVYDYECVFIVGSLQEIRDFAVRHAPTGPPRWNFAKDRQGWTYEHAGDTGWPIRRGIELHGTDSARPRLISPMQFWRAESAPRVAIRATVGKGVEGDATIYWRSMTSKTQLISKDWGEWAAQWWVPERSVSLTLTGDGKEHWYVAHLSSHDSYSGGIIGLAVDLPKMNADTRVRIREIRLLGSKDRVPGE